NGIDNGRGLLRRRTKGLRPLPLWGKAMATSVKSSFAHIVQETDCGAQPAGGGAMSSPWWSAWPPAPLEQLAARALADGLLVGVERVIAGDDLALCPALLGHDGIARVLVVGLSTAGRAWVEKQHRTEVEEVLSDGLSP